MTGNQVNLYTLTIPVLIGAIIGIYLFISLPKANREKIQLGNMLLFSCMNTFYLEILAISIWNHSWESITGAIFFGILFLPGDWVFVKMFQADSKFLENTIEIWKYYCVYGFLGFTALYFFYCSKKTDNLITINITLIGASLLSFILLKEWLAHNKRKKDKRAETRKVFQQSWNGQPFAFTLLYPPDKVSELIAKNIKVNDRVQFTIETRKKRGRKQVQIPIEWANQRIGLLPEILVPLIEKRIAQYPTPGFEGTILEIQKHNQNSSSITIQFKLPTGYSPVTERISERPHLDEEGRVHCKLQFRPDQFSQNLAQQILPDEELFLWQWACRPDQDDRWWVSRFQRKHPFATLPIDAVRFINENLVDLRGVKEMFATVSIKQRGTPLEIEIAFLPPQSTLTKWAKEEKEETD